MGLLVGGLYGLGDGLELHVGGALVDGSDLCVGVCERGRGGGGFDEVF